MQNRKTEKNIFMDSLPRKKCGKVSLDYPLAQYILKNKNSSQLFSKRKRILNFTTNDSKIYFTQKELLQIRRGKKIFRPGTMLDCALRRKEIKQKVFIFKGKRDLYAEIQQRYAYSKNYLIDFVEGSVQGVSATRMWNISLVGSIIFGMLLMTMIYRYLGQSASARTRNLRPVATVQTAEIKNESQVAGVDDKKEEINEADYTAKLLEEYKNKEQQEIEKKMLEMVKGYPIENMVSEISKRDKVVAAFLIAIAKKESNWGKRVPVLNGNDCYNYWGYRGIRDRMGTGGHTCFDSPKDAVDTVAKRMEFLVSNKKLNTPAKMVIWKCGSNCEVTGGQAAANKWISDVEMYFRKLNSTGK